MPFLDVSEILSDADISDTIVVKRRVEVINSFGRPVFSTHTIPDISAVVTTASGNDLMRLPEDQRMGRNLCIVTNFKLRGPSPGFQPDLINWYGDDFVVKSIDLYPQYGAGFVQAIVGSVDTVDVAVQDIAPE